ncbi:hypothetical protein B0T16DRAFT_336850 [Cercophora newfieldiana]|uniref:Uncharacterized protein n=1 Tax=Cercophora newfieldiana TaxID=92897 RepID=A0AA40CIQ2_9PEZI|nr:hypothetical protein B0T16DRAFT_336850 [Cercophora newfieldiana]
MELQVLNASVQGFPIPEQTQNQISAAFWGYTSGDLKERPSAAHYFDAYYSPRCQHFTREGGRHISARTHSDVTHIASWILQDDSRETIRSRLLNQATERGNAVDEKAIETSIDMCASLLAMIECGKQEFVFSGRSPMLWDSGGLRSCLARRFAPQTSLDASSLKLVKAFTGRNLSRVGGIRIKWTNNLVDHLLLTDDDQAVSIFQCASFLMIQKQSPNSIFGIDFIDETIRTLALLFPQNDRNTKPWLHSQLDSGGAPLDTALTKCGSLRAEERRFECFSFWRDRLVILKEAYDESRPKTLLQWWFDRRNGEQWFTFWIAVLVFAVAITFGLIQSIEGALQVYLSYKALQSAG